MTREELAQLTQNPNVRTFLDLISETEGTTKHGYSTAFGGGVLPALNDHPRTVQTFGKKGEKTSAAGRYQFLQSTWDDVAKKYGLTDFGPTSQDIAAVELLRRNGALSDVLNGDFKQAIARSGATWASLPSSPYNQPKKSNKAVDSILARLRSKGPSSQAQLIAKTPATIKAAVELASAAPTTPMQDALPPTPMLALPAPTDATPAWAEQVRSTQLAGEPMPAPVQGGDETPGWQTQLTQDAVSSDANTMRDNAVSSFFGEQPVPQVALPASLDESINRYLAKLA
jgi:muramidase (phage lysozyme)